MVLAVRCEVCQLTCILSPQPASPLGAEGSSLCPHKQSNLGLSSGNGVVRGVGVGVGVGGLEGEATFWEMSASSAGRPVCVF